MQPHEVGIIVATTWMRVLRHREVNFLSELTKVESSETELNPENLTLDTFCQYTSDTTNFFTRVVINA